MATVLPPLSKRQKTEASDKAREQQVLDEIPKNAGSVRIQFFDEITGLPVGVPTQVSVADASPKNLELLLNNLQANDPSELISYRFTLSVKSKNSKDENSISYPSSLWKSLIVPGLVNTEEILNISAAPQAVFKVQAVSRCASCITGHSEAILATQFSPASSARMVSGSGDNTARIWDCDTGTPVHTLRGHTSWVLAVSWSPDDSRIATGSMDNTVRIWDSKTGTQLGSPMKGHSKWVTSLAWEPYHVQKQEKPRLASASKDATVRIWSTNQQTILMVLTGHKGSVSCVKWGGLGFIYTGSHDKTVKVWNSSDGTLAMSLETHAHWVNHLALSTDFVNRTAFYDHTAHVPSSTEAKLTKARERFSKAVTVQGQLIERLVSASDDFTMYLWEPLTGNKPVARMVGHQKQVNHVTFSPDGLFIASSGFDNHTKVWNGRDGKFLHTLRGHVAPVYQCAFSPDSRLLVTGSKDTTLKVWDMQTFNLSMDLPGHQDEVYAVDWSPDGQKVGSGGKDKAVRVWRH
ncbi:BgTH12-00093 [Blumeria graminis f. sp. triticale]|uniref:Ribosome assembly protein 4 n=3 Tax=Blumeria graminis TaxID=34373 RepID=A0A381L5V8_BLUGR|nr:WD-repeat protein [Blumeria graminis f. sp. tritici 96224]CAD6504585.1 BgTH12-00093 [Blumeria graminis f. sp. triticale]VDB92587.1 Bgt-2860 [Blumeria graminis f. sp. tritici]